MVAAATHAELCRQLPDVVIDFVGDGGPESPSILPTEQTVHGIIMFADLAGFTWHCERAETDREFGVDDLVNELNLTLGTVVDVALCAGGDVLKFAGDAVLVLWQCDPEAIDKRARFAQVLEAAAVVQRSVMMLRPELRRPLSLKIGLAAGEVTLLHVGSNEQRQFVCGGAAVIAANSAQGYANPGEIVAHEGCQSLIPSGWKSSAVLNGVIRLEPAERRKFSMLGGRAQQQQQQQQPGSDRRTLPPTVPHLKHTSELDTSCPAPGQPGIGGLPRYKTSSLFGLDFVMNLSTTRPKRGSLKPCSKEAETIWRASMLVCKTSRVGSAAGADMATTSPRRLALVPGFESSAQAVRRLREYIPAVTLSMLDRSRLYWVCELRDVTTVFLRIAPVHPTTGPPLGHKLIHSIYVFVNEMVTELGGTLNKVIGFDKPGGCTFLVIFGLPGEKHEDDACRGVHAAMWLSRHLELRHRGEICLSAGVTSGQAFCGVVGHVDRYEYTIIGDSVNTACRLVTQAQLPGRIICDAATRMHARNGHAWYALELDELVLKGKQKMLELYSVGHPPKLSRDVAVILPRESNQGDASNTNPKHSSCSLRIGCNHSVQGDGDDELLLAGRAQILARLRVAVQATKSRRNAHELICLVGGQGLGKSSILRWLERHCRTADVPAMMFTATAVDGETPFNLVRALISTSTGLTTCLDATQRTMTLLTLLGRDVDDSTLGPVSHLFGLEMSEPPGYSPKTREVLINLLLGLMTIAPLVLLIDEAQHTDAASWSILHWLFQQRLPLLSVLGLQSIPPSSGIDVSAADSRAEIITLSPLTLDSVAELAYKLLNVSSVSDRLLQLLVDRALGIPLYIIELLYSLRKEGGLQYEDRTRTSSTSKETYRHCDLLSDRTLSIPLPVSIKGIIVCRIDALPPLEQLTVKCAAIVGTIFSLEQVATILPVGDDTDLQLIMHHLCALKIFVIIPATRCRSPDGVSPTLARNSPGLMGKGVQFGFRQTLVQEVAYSLWPSSQRRNLHTKMALRIERDCGFHCTLLHHWRAAGDVVKIALTCIEAGRGAAEVKDVARAVDYFEESLCHLGKSSARGKLIEFCLVTAAAKIALGEIASSCGRFKEAIDHFRAGLAHFGGRFGLYDVLVPQATCWPFLRHLRSNRWSAQRSCRVGPSDESETEGCDLLARGLYGLVAARHASPVNGAPKSRSQIECLELVFHFPALNTSAPELKARIAAVAMAEAGMSRRPADAAKFRRFVAAYIETSRQQLDSTRLRGNNKGPVAEIQSPMAYALLHDFAAGRPGWASEISGTGLYTNGLKVEPAALAQFTVALCYSGRLVLAHALYTVLVNRHSPVHVVGLSDVLRLYGTKNVSPVSRGCGGGMIGEQRRSGGEASACQFGWQRFIADAAAFLIAVRTDDVAAIHSGLARWGSHNWSMRSGVLDGIAALFVAEGFVRLYSSRTHISRCASRDIEDSPVEGSVRTSAVIAALGAAGRMAVQYPVLQSGQLDLQARYYHSRGRMKKAAKLLLRADAIGGRPLSARTKWAATVKAKSRKVQVR